MHSMFLWHKWHFDTGFYRQGKWHRHGVAVLQLWHTGVRKSNKEWITITKQNCKSLLWRHTHTRTQLDRTLDSSVQCSASPLSLSPQSDRTVHSTHTHTHTHTSKLTHWHTPAQWATISHCLVGVQTLPALHTHSVYTSRSRFLTAHFALLGFTTHPACSLLLPSPPPPPPSLPPL